MNESSENQEAPNTSDASPLSRTAVSGVMESAVSASASDPEGDGLNSGGPTVLAQPPVEGAEGKGSSKLPDTDNTTASKSKPALALVKDVFVSAQDTIVTSYRVASESTDDFVHDSPWKAIAFAVLGGVIVGMLAAR
jgi:ElaB protein